MEKDSTSVYQEKKYMLEDRGAVGTGVFASHGPVAQEMGSLQKQ